MVKGDPTQVLQVLMNLCANAAYAMGEKGGALTVDISNVELDPKFVANELEMDSGPYVKIMVTDTGIGIPKQVIDRIFEPYFTTKPAGEGTGLGLAVVHGIVRKMGGTIHVLSEPGKGSTFSVYIPRISEDRVVQEANSKVIIQPGQERILWVDDEIQVVEIGKDLLERLGYKVRVRTSSVDALELFRAEPASFDLVITDLAMPKLNGKDFSRQLLKIRPDIPIILCTGFGDSLTEGSLEGLGIRDVLVKPIVSRDLARKVRETLDRVKQNGADIL